MASTSWITWCRSTRTKITQFWRCTAPTLSSSPNYQPTSSSTPILPSRRSPQARRKLSIFSTTSRKAPTSSAPRTRPLRDVHGSHCSAPVGRDQSSNLGDAFPRFLFFQPRDEHLRLTSKPTTKSHARDVRPWCRDVGVSERDGDRGEIGGDLKQKETVLQELQLFVDN